MRILIIEGVTGAGKSETLRALGRQPEFAARLGPGRVISEEDTLGDVMDEIAQLGGPPARHAWRLDRVVAALERESGAAPDARFVLERFHLSYYALLPDWELYEVYERALERLGCASVLLTLDPSALAERSLERADRRGTEWTEGMLAHYGSRDATLTAIARSQQRRLDALALTRLPTLVIDTTGQAWDDYAREILKWWLQAG
ncbi:MAG: hypothetical protein ABIQ99_15060 [Thermoflexales bacterium]